MNVFPFAHLLAVILGAAILYVIKKRFKRIRNIELLLVFVLYVILVGLFTEQAMNLFRMLIGCMQLQ